MQDEIILFMRCFLSCFYRSFVIIMRIIRFKKMISLTQEDCTVDVWNLRFPTIQPENRQTFASHLGLFFLKLIRFIMGELISGRHGSL